MESSRQPGDRWSRAYAFSSQQAPQKHELRALGPV
jgi:hypothetical protein